jgi:HNH endonuclease
MQTTSLWRPRLGTGLYRRYLKDKTCLHCKKTYHPRRRSQKACSSKCRAELRRKPSGYFDKHGYILVSINGKQIPEHRLVMEKFLGRKLKRFETVHHKDGKRSNNKLNNLKLWTGKHGKGVRVSDLLKLYLPLIKQML